MNYDLIFEPLLKKRSADCLLREKKNDQFFEATATPEHVELALSLESWPSSYAYACRGV